MLLPNRNVLCACWRNWIRCYLRPMNAERAYTLVQVADTGGSTVHGKIEIPIHHRSKPLVPCRIWKHRSTDEGCAGRLDAAVVPESRAPMSMPPLQAKKTPILVNVDAV